MCPPGYRSRPLSSNDSGVAFAASPDAEVGAKRGRFSACGRIAELRACVDQQPIIQAQFYHKNCMECMH